MLAVYPALQEDDNTPNFLQAAAQFKATATKK